MRSSVLRIGVIGFSAAIGVATAVYLAQRPFELSDFRGSQPLVDRHAVNHTPVALISQKTIAKSLTTSSPGTPAILPTSPNGQSNVPQEPVVCQQLTVSLSGQSDRDSGFSEAPSNLFTDSPCERSADNILPNCSADGSLTSNNPLTLPKAPDAYVGYDIHAADNALIPGVQELANQCETMAYEDKAPSIQEIVLRRGDDRPIATLSFREVMSHEENGVANSLVVADSLVDEIEVLNDVTSVNGSSHTNPHSELTTTKQDLAATETTDNPLTGAGQCDVVPLAVDVGLPDHNETDQKTFQESVVQTEVHRLAVDDENVGTSGQPELANLDQAIATGKLLMHEAKINMAIATLTAANEKWPSSPAILKLLAAAYFHNRNYEAATASLEISLDINPEDAETHHLLGWALRKIGRIHDSRQHFRIAYEIHPQYPELP